MNIFIFFNIDRQLLFYFALLEHVSISVNDDESAVRNVGVISISIVVWSRHVDDPRCKQNSRNFNIHVNDIVKACN